MPDASPYLEAAYAVFAVLIATYVAIIAYRMRNTARERRELEAELAARTGDRLSADEQRELERV